MRAIIVGDDDREHDGTEWVRALYDAATSSMDWGSGFLDSGDVDMIRSLAAVCGFADVDYPEDVCLHCGCTVTMHKDQSPRLCWRGQHEQHNADYLRSIGREVPPVCECPGYVRRGRVLVHDIA